MFFSFLYPHLLLPFFLSIALARPPNLLSRSSPALSLTPPTAASPYIHSRPYYALNTTNDTPTCLSDAKQFRPPLTSDCDYLIQGILLDRFALFPRHWHGSGSYPVASWVHGSCRIFLFAAIAERVSDDIFEGVRIAVTAATILKACVGAGTPNSGGEMAIGPKKVFVATVVGKQI